MPKGPLFPCYATGFDMFLQTVNHMRGSDSEHYHVWK